MQIRLSAVLQLIDGYRRRPVRASEASFLVGHSPVKPVYKQNGYFVFPNLPAGQTRIDILSPLFLPETIEINVSDKAGDYSTTYMVLSPGRAYPFSGAPTSLRGRFLKNGAPAAHERILFYVSESKELLKVAQDDLKQGAVEVKLFSSQQTWRLPLPGKFLIANKDGKKREICFITGVPDSNGVYPLEEPLKFAHSRATPLIELVEFRSAADGSFFIAVPERYSTMQQAELEMPSAGKSWKIAVSHGKETSLGDIEV